MIRMKRLAILVLFLIVFIYMITIMKPRHGQQAKGLSIEKEIFNHRMQHVERECSNTSLRQYSEEESYKRLALNPKLLNNVLVSDKYRVLYCYVPKVACTNWKRVMLLLNSDNFTDITKIPSDSVHRKNVFMKLSDFQEDDILQRLRTYNKFIFVRHPIERVISAFRNKFEKNYTSSQYFKERFGVAIQKKYRQSDEISPKGDGVKFLEFTQYLIDIYESDPSKFNEHWAPASQLCHPCDIRFNLIGKYETLKEDSESILKTIESPDDVRFPPVNPSKTSTFVDEYISSLNEAQYEGLMKIFNNDFRLFDYQYKRKNSL